MMKKHPHANIYIWWLLIAGLLAAFFLYTHQLEGSSLWRDEALTVNRARQPLLDILANRNIVAGISSPDLHPPLYFLMLHGWQAAAGESLFAWRYFSVLATMLALALFFRLGRLVGGHETGLWLFALALLSPFFYWYAQEARMYALVLFLSLLLQNLLWQLLNRIRNWPAFAAFTLTALALVLTHYSGLFLAAFAGGLVVLTLLRRQFAWWLILMPAAGGLAALWLLLPHLLELLNLPGFAVFSTRPFHRMALEAINTFSLGSAAPAATPGWRLWLFVLLGVAGFAGCWRLPPPRRIPVLQLSLGGFLLPLLLIFLAALLQANYSNPRHLTILAPSWFLLMGFGLTTLRRLNWPLAALIGALLIFLGGGALYQTITAPPVVKDDVRGVAAYIETRMQPDDIVVWHDAVMMQAYAFYAPDLPFLAVPEFSRHDPADSLQRLENAVAGHERIWFLERPAPFYFDDTLLGGWLDERMVRVDFQQFPASWTALQLVLYQRPRTVTTLPAGSIPTAVAGSSLQIDGVRLPPTAVAGDGIWTDLYWSGEPAGDTAACLRLRDSAAVIWSQGCTVINRPAAGAAGGTGTAAQPLWLPLPDGLAPVTYQLELFFADQTEKLGAYTISAGEPPPPPIALFANGLQLHGISWESSAFQAGLWSVGTMLWSAREPQPVGLTTIVRLVDRWGRELTRTVAPVAPPDYPLDQWPAGQSVRSFLGIPLPVLADGRYQVQIALQDKNGTMIDGAGLLNGRWQAAGWLQIDPWPLENTLPETAVALEGLSWNDQYRLAGYELERQQQQLTVTLYWRVPEAPAPDADYHVFVHLAPPDQPPVAQSTGIPAAGARPISSWRPEEIVTDTHILTLPADLDEAGLVISVGLFNPEQPDQRIPVSRQGAVLPGSTAVLGPLPAP